MSTMFLIGDIMMAASVVGLVAMGLWALSIIRHQERIIRLQDDAIRLQEEQIQQLEEELKEARK